jgi:hypothetical protein
MVEIPELRLAAALAHTSPDADLEELVLGAHA